MKMFVALGGALVYFFHCVTEIGASADWWEPMHQPHWWLAVCFLCLALDCVRIAVTTGERGEP